MGKSVVHIYKYLDVNYLAGDKRVCFVVPDKVKEVWYDEVWDLNEHGFDFKGVI